MNDNLEEYDRLHSCCPKCGSSSHSSTCMGYVFRGLETHKDENNVVCTDCGWKGITHDLVESKKDLI
jgi:hypothetical protein